MMNKKFLLIFLLLAVSAILVFIPNNINIVNAANETNETQFGSLFVQTDPTGANVFLDNALKGVSPITITDVAVGSHYVEARKTGYANTAQTVNILVGQTTSVTITLAQLTYTCTDTDNGVVYNIKGTAKVTRSDGFITQTATDTCQTNKNLIEYSCSSSSASSLTQQTFRCSKNCRNGACV